MVLSFVFGTVHSFSAWLATLELQFGASRTASSLSYSIALVSLTTAVFFGGRIYHRYSPATLGVVCLCLGLVGVAFAATNIGLWAVWLGFGLIFGFANGIGYGFALQFAARARPDCVGWVMGLVTAAYASGAAATSNAFSFLSGQFGPAGVMAGHAIIMIAALPIVYILLKGTTFRFSKSASSGQLDASGQLIIRFWLAYGLAVFAGLMLISQASEVLRLAGGSITLVASIPAFLAASNLAGSVSGGFAADRLSGRATAIALPLGTVIAILALVIGSGALLSWMTVLMAGYFYGATIAAYPSIILRKFGAENNTVIYGRVFTAWGTAGLAAPVLAGLAFDRSGSYLPAIFIAGFAALLSAFVAARI